MHHHVEFTQQMAYLGYRPQQYKAPSNHGYTPHKTAVNSRYGYGDMGYTQFRSLSQLTNRIEVMDFNPS